MYCHIFTFAIACEAPWHSFRFSLASRYPQLAAHSHPRSPQCFLLYSCQLWLVFGFLMRFCQALFCNQLVYLQLLPDVLVTVQLSQPFSGSSSLWRRRANHVRIVIRSMVRSAHFPPILNASELCISYAIIFLYTSLALPATTGSTVASVATAYFRLSCKFLHNSSAHSYPESAPFWGVLFLLVSSSTGSPIFSCAILCVSMFKLRSGCTNASIKTLACLLLHPYKCVRFKTTRLMMNGMLPHYFVHDKQRAQ